MNLDDTFTGEAPIDDGYATILDLHKVAPCLPGAQFISDPGDGSPVRLRAEVGPTSMQYRGDVEIVERDPAGHRAVMRVRAREVRGQGTADATAEVKLHADGATTRGDVHVEVAL